MKQIVYVVTAGSFLVTIQVFTSFEAANGWLLDKFDGDGFIRKVVVDEHYYD